jgi:hypothetical protein
MGDLAAGHLSGGRYGVKSGLTAAPHLALAAVDWAKGLKGFWSETGKISAHDVDLVPPELRPYCGCPHPAETAAFGNFYSSSSSSSASSVLNIHSQCVDP